jgi:hypothetical protein
VRSLYAYVGDRPEDLCKCDILSDEPSINLLVSMQLSEKTLLSSLILPSLDLIGGMAL